MMHQVSVDSILLKISLVCALSVLKHKMKYFGKTGLRAFIVFNKNEGTGLHVLTHCTILRVINVYF